VPLSMTEVVLEKIDQDFEAGMQMIKQLTLEKEFQELNNKMLLTSKLLQYISPEKKS